MTRELPCPLESLERHADLGHAKRNRCFVRQVRAVVQAPGAAPAQAVGQASSNWANAKSWYDFLDNDRVTTAQLRVIRRKMVAERLFPRADRVVHP